MRMQRGVDVITRIGTVAAVLALSACTPSTAALDVPSSTGPPAYEATVSRVVDGDTVVVRGERSPAETVRVLSIDTPETKDPRKPVQCWGPEATAFATVTLLDQRVRLVPDPTQDAVDRYGRSLAYVELVERNPVTGAPAKLIVPVYATGLEFSTPPVELTMDTASCVPGAGVVFAPSTYNSWLASTGYC